MPYTHYIPNTGGQLMTEHPLTDEICLEITNRPYMIDTRKDDMRAAYDKGRDDTLSKVTRWIFDNLEDPRLLDDIYVVVVGEDDDLLVAINTDQIVDELYKVIHPQEDNS